MGTAVVQLLVLAGIAIFLILRLRSVLGTREGFEKPPAPIERRAADKGFEVIEGGPDRDITDHVNEGSAAAKALSGMKREEPSFSVTEFLGGARSAYEMILMAFENGDMSDVKGFLSDDVAEAFEGVIEDRKSKGLHIEATFVGVRETAVYEAEFDEKSKLAEISVKFVGELTSVVKNAEGEVVEGSANEIKRQRDVWTFARTLGSKDPNWQLVATGE